MGIPIQLLWPNAFEGKGKDRGQRPSETSKTENWSNGVDEAGPFQAVDHLELFCGNWRHPTSHGQLDSSVDDKVSSPQKSPPPTAEPDFVPVFWAHPKCCSQLSQENAAEVLSWWATLSRKPPARTAACTGACACRPTRWAPCSWVCPCGGSGASEWTRRSSVGSGLGK